MRLEPRRDGYCGRSSCQVGVENTVENAVAERAPHGQLNGPSFLASVDGHGNSNACGQAVVHTAAIALIAEILCILPLLAIEVVHLSAQKVLVRQVVRSLRGVTGRGGSSHATYLTSPQTLRSLATEKQEGCSRSSCRSAETTTVVVDDVRAPSHMNSPCQHDARRHAEQTSTK